MDVTGQKAPGFIKKHCPSDGHSFSLVLGPAAFRVAADHAPVGLVDGSPAIGALPLFLFRFLPELLVQLSHLPCNPRKFIPVFQGDFERFANAGGTGYHLDILSRTDGLGAGRTMDALDLPDQKPSAKPRPSRSSSGGHPGPWRSPHTHRRRCARISRSLRRCQSEDRHTAFRRQSESCRQ